MVKDLRAPLVGCSLMMATMIVFSSHWICSTRSPFSMVLNQQQTLAAQLSRHGLRESRHWRKKSTVRNNCLKLHGGVFSKSLSLSCGPSSSIEACKDVYPLHLLSHVRRCKGHGSNSRHNKLSSRALIHQSEFPSEYQSVSLSGSRPFSPSTTLFRLSQTKRIQLLKPSRSVEKRPDGSYFYRFGREDDSKDGDKSEKINDGADEVTKDAKRKPKKKKRGKKKDDSLVEMDGGVTKDKANALNTKDSDKEIVASVAKDEEDRIVPSVTADKGKKMDTGDTKVEGIKLDNKNAVSGVTKVKDKKNKRSKKGKKKVEGSNLFQASAASEPQNLDSPAPSEGNQKKKNITFDTLISESINLDSDQNEEEKIPDTFTNELTKLDSDLPSKAEKVSVASPAPSSPSPLSSPTEAKLEERLGAQRLEKHQDNNAVESKFVGDRQDGKQPDQDDTIVYQFEPQEGFETPIKSTYVRRNPGSKPIKPGDVEAAANAAKAEVEAVAEFARAASDAVNTEESAPQRALALRRTVLDWLNGRVDELEARNPTGAFAARTLVKWINAGPEGAARVAKSVINNPPDWKEVESLVSPWLRPFPEPLKDVRSPIDIADARSRFVRVLGVKVHYIQAWPKNPRPKAPALVLLHGFNGCTFTWRHVMQDLADAVGSRVLAFDRPPFGLSERPTKWEGGLVSSPYSSSFGVNLTTGLTRALGLGRYVLVGHSAGGPIAAAAATHTPRCKGLVLVAPAVSLSKRTQLDLAQKNESRQWPVPDSNLSTILRLAYTGAVIRIPGIGINYIRAATERQAEELRKNGVRYDCPYDESPLKVAEGYLKPLQSRDWDIGILEHYKALLAEGGLLAPGPNRTELPPTVLIIQGRRDPTVPAWVAEAYAEEKGGKEAGIIYREYQDVGHLPMEQDPVRFVKDVAAYCHEIALREVDETKNKLSR